MDPVNLNSIPNGYVQKYYALKRKCEHLQQVNERLVNRVHHVKKIIKRYKLDRRVLMEKLSEHGDSYTDVQVPAMWDEVLSTLSQPAPAPEDTAALASTSDLLEDDKSHLAALVQAQEASTEVAGVVEVAAVEEAAVCKEPAVSPLVQARVDCLIATSRPTAASMNFAFHMYCQQRRSVLKEEYVKIHKCVPNPIELSQLLVQEWKALGQHEKTVFHDLVADLDQDTKDSVSHMDTT